ncbi:hypothetical protein F2Q70_00033664 [Brassica cretica]|uniref:Uncharacterized protein n=1 Tax=Brassica cretica TaxID=69181 RepID=A0A8S9GVD2_BRACR|nr:hypothetical protein F2Q70_00033664 [Brassica cretica]KAF2550511.1 hypothetical protein F2Q68_00038156 [Brassica cretica]
MARPRIHRITPRPRRRNFHLSLQPPLMRRHEYTCGLRESIMDRREEGFATVDSDVVNM